MNPSLRNNPRIQQATNFVGRDRQAGEVLRKTHWRTRDERRRAPSLDWPSPTVARLLPFILIIPPPRPPAPNARRLPVSPPLTRVLSVLSVAFLRPRQKVRRSRKRGEGRDPRSGAPRCH